MADASLKLTFDQVPTNSKPSQGLKLISGWFPLRNAWGGDVRLV
jgi:hypothetical protein